MSSDTPKPGEHDPTLSFQMPGKNKSGTPSVPKIKALIDRATSAALVQLDSAGCGEVAG
jgi:hypothetical protein